MDQTGILVSEQDETSPANIATVESSKNFPSKDSLPIQRTSKRGRKPLTPQQVARSLSKQDTLDILLSALKLVRAKQFSMSYRNSSDGLHLTIGNCQATETNADIFLEEMTNVQNTISASDELDSASGG